MSGKAQTRSMNLFKSKNNLLIFLIVILAIILRFIWLDKIPPSLYSDEAGQGYNAYSILKTGKDEHGVFLPVSLRSFGDWKPPLPSYLMIPAIAIFGLNEFSVRLPSAIFGVGSVMITFFLIHEIFRGQVFKTKLALLASFFLAISPWHILQSRSAMLVIISLLLLKAGVYFYFLWHRHKFLLPLSIIFFTLSVYSYYGMRIITPLIILILTIQDYKNIRLHLGSFFLSLLLGIIILYPLFSSFIHQPDVVFGRAKTVSVFYDQGVKLRQWELITQDGMNFPVNLARFFHNSVYLYGRNILERYFSHFEGNFLFLRGDTSQPFQIPGMGILYLIDGIFILAGIYIYLAKFYKKTKIILYWFIISFIPAAFTFMTPSANRTFSSVVIFIVFISLGLIFLLRNIKYKKAFILAITLLYIISFNYFLTEYFLVLPKKHTDWWNYGWKPAAEYVQKVQAQYSNIVIIDTGGMPYVYFLIYNKYDPAVFQKEAVRTYISDRFGFENVYGFEKYIFITDNSWQDLKKNLLPNSLYLVPIQQSIDDRDYIEEIKYPDGRPAIKVFST